MHINKADLENLKEPVSFKITPTEENAYLISYSHFDEELDEVVEVEEIVNSLPCTLNTHIGRLVFTKGEAEALAPNQKLMVSIVPPIVVAKSCLGALSIAPTSKTTSIAYISYLDVNIS